MQSQSSLWKCMGNTKVNWQGDSCHTYSMSWKLEGRSSPALQSFVCLLCFQKIILLSFPSWSLNLFVHYSHLNGPIKDRESYGISTRRWALFSHLNTFSFDTDVKFSDSLNRQWILCSSVDEACKSRLWIVRLSSCKSVLAGREVPDLERSKVPIVLFRSFQGRKLFWSQWWEHLDQLHLVLSLGYLSY